MAAALREAASLVYSTDAFKHRAAKAGLSHEEIEAIVNNNVKSLAQFDFAIFPPGTSPSDDATKDFTGQVGVTLATITFLKFFIFEAHTLVDANIKKILPRKKDGISTHSFLPSAETNRTPPTWWWRVCLCQLRFGFLNDGERQFGAFASWALCDATF